MRPSLLPFLLLLVPGPLRAQEPAARPAPSSISEETPRFPTRVELVTVDVVVTDGERNPVRGLTAADFSLKEDGVPQKISSFEAIEVPREPLAVPPPRAPVSSNVSATATAWTGRTFAVVLDNLHLELFQSERATTAVSEFLRTSVREGDRVTLASTGGEIWWSTRMEAGRDELLTLLGRVQGRYLPERGPDWMSDYEALQIWVHNDPQVQTHVARRFVYHGVADRDLPELIVRARALETYRRAADRNRLTLEMMRRILAGLEGRRGRKSLILVSAGFGYDRTLEGFQQVAEASARSNVAIYFLDVQGLAGLPVHMAPELREFIWNDAGLLADSMERFRGGDGSESLAVDSGGFVVRNSNDLASGLQRIARESRVYYLLGYEPTDAARDGRYRSIEVELARKGLEVRARKGYHAPAEPGPSGAAPAEASDDWFELALDSPFDVEDIPLRVSAYVFEATTPGKARVLLAGEVDIRGLPFREQEGRWLDELDVVLMVGQLESSELLRHDIEADLALLPTTRERLERSWLSVGHGFELAPGRYHAKVMVREGNGGRIGSVVHPFDVPLLAGLRTSSPVLSVNLDSGPDDSGASRLPAHRAFPAGSRLFVRFDVYGAALHEATGQPSVRSGLEIRRRDGTLLGRGQLEAMTPTPEGKLTRTSAVALAGLGAGEYELVLVVNDDVTRKRLFVREPFTLEAPSEP